MNANEEQAPPKISARERFLRSLIAGLHTEENAFYERRGVLYIDTACLGGKKLVALRGSEFVSFLLAYARIKDGILLHAEDVRMVAEHVSAYAESVAKPLSSDPRACWVGEVLWINPGWPDGRLIRVCDGQWSIEASPGRLFAPLPLSMAMPVPVPTPAAEFPSLVEAGITSFGEFHAFFCTTLATMMMPMDDVHPILILTGEGAKGKTTTMKLMTQLVDPDQGNECMIVSEDQRNILVTCQYRKTLGLDNASRLPIPEDLLSQMFAGGTFNERKLYSNNELSQTRIERMRVIINGVSPDFSKSDFFTKALFLEQPVVTNKNAQGQDMFTSLSVVENRWKTLLPKALGAVLTVIAEGVPHYHAWVKKRLAGGRAPDATVRFVEYTVMGEAFARAMGYAADTFSAQVYELNNRSKEDAVGSDECAQMILSWLEGERGHAGSSIDGWEDVAPTIGGFPKGDSYELTIGELYKEIRLIAVSRGYSVYSMKWLNSAATFGRAVNRSVQNIENAGWRVQRVAGRTNGRRMVLTRKELLPPKLAL